VVRAAGVGHPHERDRQDVASDGAADYRARYGAAIMTRMVIGMAILLVAFALCLTGVGIPLAMVLVGIGWGIGGFKDA
jgi:hypothetical protein